MEERRKSSIHGTDEIYATVLRVGGKHPTAVLSIPGKLRRARAFGVSSQALAKQLGNKLYDTVKLSANVEWDPDSLEIVDLEVTGMDPGWEDISLAQLVRESGGRLPFELTED